MLFCGIKAADEYRAPYNKKQLARGAINYYAPLFGHKIYLATQGGQ